MYDALGIDYHKKMIIYSDNVNVEKALGIQAQCKEIGIPCKPTVQSRLCPQTQMDMHANHSARWVAPKLSGYLNILLTMPFIFPLQARSV